jgi:TPR repeat protein
VWELAAQFNHAEAMSMLGALEQHKGNLVGALAWFMKSEANGYEPAKMD